MKVLVTGGTGYKGSVLVPKLLALGHDVDIVDTCWFSDDTRANLYKYDIRQGVQCEGYEAIIHLAGIANDPCGELDSKLTWEVNVLATMRLADAAVRAGVKQFIFASSASVYGVKGNQAIKEGEPLSPVSDYNKTKMCSERILLSYSDRMVSRGGSRVHWRWTTGYVPDRKRERLLSNARCRGKTGHPAIPVGGSGWEHRLAAT